eukprot:c45730_g1_i1 orf=316-471(+)
MYLHGPLNFAKAISSFLAAQEIDIQSLRLPIRDEELPDVEFADNTAMYLHG